MVDVSEKMIEAGRRAYGGFVKPIPDDELRAIYTAMHSAKVDGETVERVARALYAEAQAEALRIQSDAKLPSFDEDDEESRRVCMNMARAAIAAMGEGDVR